MPIYVQPSTGQASLKQMPVFKGGPTDTSDHGIDTK
jgi:hypothetical protein